MTESIVVVVLGVVGIIVAFFVGWKAKPDITSTPTRTRPTDSIDLGAVKDELDLIEKEKKSHERDVKAPPITDDSVNAVLDELKERQ